LSGRWPCKEDLGVEALDHVLPSPVELPDTGSVRDDILELLRRMAAMINSPAGCALQALLAEVDRDNPLIGEVGPAMLGQRFLADGAPVPDAFVVSVVDGVVMPLLRRPD